MKSDRRLIEEWLPIAELGIESGRERTPLTPYPALNRLHTWWARRPLIISRAAVLASILPADANKKKFIHALGIHGDPVKVQRLINQAVRTGQRYKDGFGYERAFKHILDASDNKWFNDELGGHISDLVIVDPTAGGGSIPFEATKMGATALVNDLNPVAVFIMYATLKWPILYGNTLKNEYDQLSSRYMQVIRKNLLSYFPPSDSNITPIAFLWARTVQCPHCSGLVPLSPIWCLAPDGTGVKLKPHKANGPRTSGRICSFAIVKSVQKQSEGTISDGDGICPYPDCKRVISGDEIKAAARSGVMGEQLYAVVCKKRTTTRTKTGKSREKWIKEYRAPEHQDDNSEKIRKKLEEKLQQWEILNMVPTEAYNHMYADRSKIYGVNYWRDLFSPRQLLCHGMSVEVFKDLFDEDKKNGDLTDMRKAAYGYLAISLDTMITYNNRLSRWERTIERVRNNFERHDYAFKWSYAEMNPLVTGLGYEWAFGKTAKCVREILDLIGTNQHAKLDQPVVTIHEPKITCKSGDDLDHIGDGTADVVVMDPPYYDNVMYAELSDFFYVWLKRTAGLVFPEMFQRNMTDKENEAVANPAKFTGQKRAKAMADQDYQDRMAMIFEECRRVLKPSGIMTVMFMHKSTGAWDALTKSIITAGFYITTSWPINSEARGSLHIKDKAAAKSTILLACRPREVSSDVSYWEDVEPKVRKAVRGRIAEFEKAGMHGVDTYLSAFGPALEEFSRNWPMQRGQPRVGAESDDLYSVTPEDALEAARREVKQWRLDKLICSTADKDLDPSTAFFVLAWDAFGAPKFPYDEALHLAKAVDVDLDKNIVGKICKKDGQNLVLWDSQRLNTNGHRKISEASRSMIDVLHHVAYLGREKGADEAIKYVEAEHLDKNDSFVAALEAILEVLPPSYAHTKIHLRGAMESASNDFEALYNIYRLKFKSRMDDPVQLKLYEE